MADLIKTIYDGDEVPDYDVESDIEEEHQPKKRKTKRKNEDFDSDFEFFSTAEEYNKDPWNDLQKYIKRKGGNKVDEKIKESREYIKIIMPDSDGEEDDAEAQKSTEPAAQNGTSDDELSDWEMKEDKIRKREKRLGKNNKKKKKNADESVPEQDGITSDPVDTLEPSDEQTTFFQMNLSRPLMKAIGELNYEHPTPIQAKTIPIALEGHDICGCAATGTGKTAAFMLPILERLLFKPKKYTAVTRVLILLPTRELAIQVYKVSKQLAQYTSVEIGLAIGGVDVKVQEGVIKKRPDILVATPGRLIDHLQNTATFCLGDLEILVLDEADRMLDENFADQMKQIMKMCSRTRQTMLFSATMTDAVKDLASVCLKEPVPIFVDSNRHVPSNLRQEFVRLRKGKNTDRDAMLAALVCRTFRENAVIFVRTKRDAHRLMILLGLLGSKVVELHGNLTQPQRVESLSKFERGEADILIATDVAARGLDISGIKTVINYIMPPTHEQYIHRVGRTARAGKSGVSVSIASEEDWKLLKQIIKASSTPVKNRVIPPDIIEKYTKKLEAVRSEMLHILEEEKTEKMLHKAEQDIERGKKLAETKSKEKKRGREWFQSQRQRQLEKQRAKEIFESKIAGNKLMKKRKTKKDEDSEERKKTKKKMLHAQYIQARIAKSKLKPKKIRATKT